MPQKQPKKSKFRQPDEAWSAGPLQVARFGSNLLMKSDWSQADIDKAQAQLVAKYPEEMAAIDRLVGEIASLVSGLPAEAVMQRGWWEVARHQTKSGVESEMGREAGLALRMVDYVQSVIASMPPQQNWKEELADEDYSALADVAQQSC